MAELSADDSDWEARTLRLLAQLELEPRGSRAPSTTGRRQLRDALIQLLTPMAQQQQQQQALRTLHAVVRRCLEEPSEERWRRLRLSNARVERDLVQGGGGPSGGAVSFLRAAGFAPADFGTALQLPPLWGRPELVARLHEALSALQGAALALRGGGSGDGTELLLLPAVDLRYLAVPGCLPARLLLVINCIALI
jgi:hypothetical protein